MANRGGERLPKHRRHAKGLGVVTLSGRDHYTGRWGTDEAERTYNRLVAEWLANGRRVALRAEGLTAGRLAAEFAEHCRRRYRKRGIPTHYSIMVDRVARELTALYGDTPATEFSPKALRALRSTWTHPPAGSARRKGVCRRVANEYQGVVLAMYKWGVAQEVVPPEVLTKLQSVAKLAAGRDGVRDRPPVGPVADELVAAALPFMPPTVAAMVQLQQLTGARPGEVCYMRPGDIDRAGPVWTYRVPDDANKTAHKGRGRLVAIGPKAQVVLAPWLDDQRDPKGFLFRPTRGRRARRGHYLEKSYHKMIGLACDRAGVPRWCPNQIRHSTATVIRSRYGLDAAQVVLGHARADVTQVYADKDMSLASRVALEIG